MSVPRALAVPMRSADGLGFGSGRPARAAFDISSPWRTGLESAPDDKPGLLISKTERVAYYHLGIATRPKAFNVASVCLSVRP